MPFVRLGGAAQGAEQEEQKTVGFRSAAPCKTWADGTPRGRARLPAVGPCPEAERGALLGRDGHVSCVTRPAATSRRKLSVTCRPASSEPTGRPAAPA